MTTPANGGGAGGRSQRRLRNLLLDRRFQLKYTAMLLALSLAISCALGFLLLQQLAESSRMLALEAELDPEFAARLATSDQRLVTGLVAALLVFNGFLALGGILVTHRMAGPIYVFGRHLTTLAAGRFPKVRALRRGDEFVDVSARLAEAVTALEARERHELEALEAVVAEATGEGGLSEARRAELSRLVAEKRARLA
jgi:hypothetical protein